MSEISPVDNTELPMTAEQLLPHRPPMLLVESLIEKLGDSAKAVTTMPKQGICYDPEYQFPEFFIEIIAQAMGMANGYEALCSGEEMIGGMIVGIDSARFFGTAPPGATLSINIEKTFEFGAIKIIHGEVLDGDSLLLACDLKVWEDIG